MLDNRKKQAGEVSNPLLVVITKIAAKRERGGATLELV